MRRKGNSRELSPRQLQLLSLAAGFQASRCYSATIQELAEQLGVSRSTAFEHIAALREKGLLWAAPGRARSLRVTAKGQKLLDTSGRAAETRPAGKIAGIELAGRVAAGAPIEAIEEKQSFTLPLVFGTSDDIFALEVVGDSMTGEGIHSGDYIICRRQSTAHNGQLVVAIVDDENATLKRFFKEPACACARLEAANDAYEPIYSDDCRIAAAVLGLVRKF